MTYAYFWHEDMPFPCKVKRLLYLWIEKFDKDEYVVRRTTTNPLIHKSYPYDIITRFFTFNEVIDYIKEQVIDP
jgi:hypothetical protein